MAQIVQAPSSVTDKLLNVGLLAALVVGGYFFLDKKNKDAKEQNAEMAIDDTPEAQQADYLGTLLGKKDLTGGFMKNVDEEKLIAYAKNITNFDKVMKYYRDQFRGDSLIEDLNGPLSDSEYQQFMDNVKAAQKAQEQKAQQKPFYIVAAPTISGRTTTTGYHESAVSYNPKVPSGGFSKPIFDFRKGVRIGKALKKVSLTVPKTSKSAGYTTQLYYVEGTAGESKGKKFYVLVSQVKTA